MRVYSEDGRMLPKAHEDLCNVLPTLKSLYINLVSCGWDQHDVELMLMNEISMTAMELRLIQQIENYKKKRNENTRSGLRDLGHAETQEA